MSTAISYQFTPYPMDFKRVMFQSKLTLREYKILDGLASLIFSFPESRASLTIKTTCRQLEELININFRHIATGIKKLAEKGLVIILQKGTFKDEDGPNEPSIIKLNIKSGVTKPVTLDSPSRVTKPVTLQKTNIKKNNMSVKCSSKIKDEEKADLENRTSEKLSPALASHPDRGQEVISEFTRPAGLPEKVIQTGITKLQKRGISDIKQAISHISTALQNKSSLINNVCGYFLTLCEKMDLTSPAPAPAASTPVTAPNTQKTQDYIKKLEQVEDKEDFNKTLKAIVDTYPDEIYQVIQATDKNPYNKYVPAHAVPALYVTEFKKKFPDLITSLE